MAQPTFDAALVEALLLRSMSEEETVFADILAGMVWRRIIAREPQIETDTPTITGDIIASVVARVLRNPGGFRSETDGDYAYTAMGGDPSMLEPTNREWARLTGRSGAFSINPMSEDAGPQNLPWWDTSPGTVTIETA